ncbi:antitoxin [Dermacoccaceae bacterium W4C1]
MALNNIIGKIKGFAQKNPDKAKQAIDKVSQTVDQKTGGKYSDKIDKASDAASNGLGLEKDKGTSGQTDTPAQPKTEGGQAAQ